MDNYIVMPIEYYNPFVGTCTASFDMSNSNKQYPLANTQPGTCAWTREHRKNDKEKSIIDYILVSKDQEQNIEEIRVDTQGTHRLKGREETDHNTILMTIKKQITLKPIKKTVWNTKNKEGWKTFNKMMTEEMKKNAPSTYFHLEQIINYCLNKSIGKSTTRSK